MFQNNKVLILGLARSGYESAKVLIERGNEVYLNDNKPEEKQDPEKVKELRDLGVKDIILDPGFGFGKTMEENFRLLHEMDKLQVMDLPLLVGVSRKRMIWKTLDITADEALNGTTVINTLALAKGANILRVHDVKAAVEATRLVREASFAIE